MTDESVPVPARRPVPNVLTIAGTDPSGGAGIMADLKTFGALRAHGCAVVTAVVAQNTRGVEAVTQMTPEQVRVQLENLLADVRIDALKIGMLGSAAVIETVADILTHHPALARTYRVLDPVMVASSGDRLIDDDAVGTLREQLVPAVDVITPNLAEAGVLLDLDEIPPEADDDLAARLTALGAGVLLKGGHGRGATSTDILRLPGTDELHHLDARRIATRNTHGTGCTLSAAMTALRPQRDSWLEATREAKTYLTDALAAADDLDVGGGHGPVHHYHHWW